MTSELEACRARRNTLKHELEVLEDRIELLEKNSRRSDKLKLVALYIDEDLDRNIEQIVNIATRGKLVEATPENAAYINQCEMLYEEKPALRDYIRPQILVRRALDFWLDEVDKYINGIDDNVVRTFIDDDYLDSYKNGRDILFRVKIPYSAYCRILEYKNRANGSKRVYAHPVTITDAVYAATRYWVGQLMSQLNY